LEQHSTRPKMWKAHKVSKNWRKRKIAGLCYNILLKIRSSVIHN
jgi:hypothetical protein